MTTSYTLFSVLIKFTAKGRTYIKIFNYTVVIYCVDLISYIISVYFSSHFLFKPDIIYTDKPKIKYLQRQNQGSKFTLGLHSVQVRLSYRHLY